MIFLYFFPLSLHILSQPFRPAAPSCRRRPLQPLTTGAENLSLLPFIFRSPVFNCKGEGEGGGTDKYDAVNFLLIPCKTLIFLGCVIRERKTKGKRSRTLYTTSDAASFLSILYLLYLLSISFYPACADSPPRLSPPELGRTDSASQEPQHLESGSYAKLLCS